MNTVQAELPVEIRFGDVDVLNNFGDALSIAIMTFLNDLFQFENNVCEMDIACSEDRAKL